MIFGRVRDEQLVVRGDQDQILVGLDNDLNLKAFFLVTLHHGICPRPLLQGERKFVQNSRSASARLLAPSTW